ncbi:hypothetical protein [Mesoflavibacter zeaxanthinifaciens]|uniref:hypothetical protein n=1 Tax=Mesoflavibacter zeaxanthinifaciens TaxID=393060 RepID=UPI0026F14365|nr:hypothetical protein [Mesoflavibacter zeaxanthinifaciens]
MKNFKLTTSIKLIILCLFINSCSNETVEMHTYESKSHSMLELLNYETNRTNHDLPDEILNAELKTKFTTNVNVPEDLSSEELLEFFNNNLQDTNGSLEFIINEVTTLKFDILDGNIVNTTERRLYSNTGFTASECTAPSEYPRACECSLEGVRQCANNRVYSLTTVEAIVCAFEFWPCYGLHAAACTEQNCL